MSSTNNSSSGSPKRFWYRDWLFLPIAAVVLALDQFTKHLVTSNMVLGQSIPAHGFFRITYTYNTGALFGLFPNDTFILTIASFVGIVFLFIYYRIHPFPGILMRLSLGLQLGGALGNLIDRVRLGQVTDFITVGPWPVFNLADSSIVVGLVIIAYVVLFLDNKSNEKTEPQKRSEEASKTNNPLQ